MCEPMTWGFGIIGLLAALAIGHCGVDYFHRWQTEKLGLPPELEPRVSPPLVGAMERTVFYIAGFAGFSDLLTGMAAWLALKLAANWQSRLLTTQEQEEPRTELKNRTFIALLSGLLSVSLAVFLGMFFAKLAGSGR